MCSFLVYMYRDQRSTLKIHVPRELVKSIKECNNNHQCSAQEQVLHCKRRNKGCSSAEGSSTANSGTRAAVLPGMNRCGSFSLLSHHTLFLASEQTLKDLKDPRGTNVEVRRMYLANWALQTSPKFTIGAKYQFHQRFHQIRDPEIPITLRPLFNIAYNKKKSLKIQVAIGNEN